MNNTLAEQIKIQIFLTMSFFPNIKLREIAVGGRDIIYLIFTLDRPLGETRLNELADLMENALPADHPMIPYIFVEPEYLTPRELTQLILSDIPK